MDPMTSTAEGLSGTILECSDNQSSKLQNASDSSSADTSGQKSTDNKLTGASNASDPYKCVANGVSMVWKPEIQQWIPDNEVNEDFLAYYNSTYGIQYDYSNYDFGSTNSKDTTTSEQQSSDLTGKKLTKEEKEMRRREAAERAKNWMEIDDSKSTNVYVSRLPTDITEIEFTEFMSKCGVIMNDPRTGKPKIKLYRDEGNELKGDGTCCYVRMESVEMSLYILDGSNLRGNTIHVEKAKFEMKGEFDPQKRKRRLTAAQKKRFFERQQKVFEWKPEKPRNYRPHCECTVVLENMFTVEEVDADASRITTLKSELETLCTRFGVVKKIIVYDSNPKGIVTITFENVEHSDTAISVLNGRLVCGRTITASTWDGRTKFKKEETEAEKDRRDEAWQKFLGSEIEEESPSSSNKS